MFTIKQVTRGDRIPADDHVRLWEGRNPVLETGPDGQPQVGFTMEDGTHCTIDAGVVFVMNAAGKTVDTFRLANSDWY